MAPMEHQDILKLLIVIANLLIVVASYEIHEAVHSDNYIIEGKVFPPDTLPTNSNWQTDTTVFLKGGYHIGFLKYVIIFFKLIIF